VDTTVISLWLMLEGITYQLRGGVESHWLCVEDRRQKHIRVMFIQLEA
jgi:hypothetical protein